ncbi:hypothetical protein [Seinonella peptonophila]|nr:hypothetical protein [Seinonella peptonophila]
MEDEITPDPNDVLIDSSHDVVDGIFYETEVWQRPNGTTYTIIHARP